MDEESRVCYPKESGLCATNSRRTSGDLCSVRGWVTRLESTLGSIGSVRSGRLTVWVMGVGGLRVRLLAMSTGHTAVLQRRETMLT